MKINRASFTPEVLDEISAILNRGLSAEVKRERENVVVVELRRKATMKQPICINKIEK